MTTNDPVNDKSDSIARGRDLEEELIEEVALAEADEAMRRTTSTGERLAAFACALVMAGSAASENGLSVAAAIAAVPRPVAAESARRPA